MNGVTRWFVIARVMSYFGGTIVFPTYRIEEDLLILDAYINCKE